MRPGSLLPFALAFAPALARAGACCGSSSLLPTLITGDDRAQLGATLSNAALMGRAYSSGPAVFHGEGESESTQTLSIAAALRIFDRWQAGVQAPVVRQENSVGTAHSTRTGLGDVQASVAFEALPEWSYSAWRPQGFVFLGVTAPTGKPMSEATDPMGSDATGRGDWGLSAGSYFRKTLQAWDLFATFSFTRFLEKQIRQSNLSLRYAPNWGAAAALGVGYSPGRGDWRFGLSLSPVYEWARRYSGSLEGTRTEKLVWNAGAQVAYMPSMAWSFGLAYSDQTLLGPVHNTSLSRTASFSVQRRWEL